MAAAGHDLQPIWRRIEDLVVLSLLAIVPQLKHQYSMARPQGDPDSVCFELLGYDVLVDEHKRWAQASVRVQGPKALWWCPEPGWGTTLCFSLYALAVGILWAKFRHLVALRCPCDPR